MGDYKFRSVYSKVLLALCIVIIPAFILSLFINSIGANLVKSQISETMQQKTQYMLGTLESEVERINQLQRFFINDADLQALNFRSEFFTTYEWTETVNRLDVKLQMLNSSSKYLRSTTIMMPNMGKSLSTNAGMQELDQQQYRDTAAFLESGQLLMYTGGRLFLPLPYPTAKRPQFILMAEFESARIQQDIQLLDSRLAGTSLLLAGDGQVLFNTNEAFPVDAGWLAMLQGSGSAEQHSAPYVAHRQQSPLLQWSLVTIVDESTIWTPVRQLNAWYWVLGLVSAASIVVFAYFIYRLVHRPMMLLIRSFRQVEGGSMGGNRSFPIIRKQEDEFSFVYQQFNDMLERIDRLIKQNYEKTIHSQKTELKQLQSQINPHFLYNSLYVLYRLSQEENYEGVTQLSKHLGDYFKFITRTKSDIIPLQQELAHAESYAAIQQIRFGERIRCRFHSEGELGSWQVPRLIIQPLVENAFQHGLKDCYEDGVIQVDVSVNAEEARIVVHDNGCGLTPEELNDWNASFISGSYMGASDGIWNVHRRLNLLFGANSGLHMDLNDAGGLRITMTIRHEEGEQL